MLRYDRITYKQVPLGYKFSWSPKAVLTAALNDAQYKLDGQMHSVSGDQLLASHFPSVPLWKGLALEGLANRDSLPYAQKYGMGEVGELRDLFRGTLR
jgi:alpha-aminoadipic semialdehyde synthase